MIWNTLFALAVFSLSRFGAAAPIEERQGGLQVISNCYQNGQVALTFDGEWEQVIAVSEAELA